MQVCYVDESGCTGTLPTPTSNIQPLIVIAGLIIQQRCLHPMTIDFLNLKSRFFPGLLPNGRPFLDGMLVEVNNPCSMLPWTLLPQPA